MRLLAFAAWGLAMCAAPARGGVETSIDPVLEAWAEIATETLWPGFAPQKTPLLLFDGEASWLIGHPAPPEAFAPVEDREHWHRFAGKHELVRANTAIDVGGHLTATVMLEPGLEAREQAGVLVHEAFHVFQRQNHADWMADESALFQYPYDELRNLHLRRVETRTWRLAVEADNPVHAMGWALSAAHSKRSRLRLLPESIQAYERKVELFEGLARYVQRRAVDANREPDLPDRFDIEDVRERGYAMGFAAAHLLDVYGGEWKERVGTTPGTYLEDLLIEALETREARAMPFGHNASFELRGEAEMEVMKYRMQLLRRRKEFMEAPGWSVSIRFKNDDHFMPAGFDPMNVVRLSARDLLHTRWVRLSCESANVEIDGGKALTMSREEGLFAGLVWVLVTGLEDEPDLVRTDDGFRISAGPLQAEFTHAKARWNDKVLEVLIGA